MLFSENQHCTSNPIVLHETAIADGNKAEYRLVRICSDAKAASYSLSVCFADDEETLSCFTGSRLIAEAFSLLAARETVLPNTLHAVWEEFCQ